MEQNKLTIGKVKEYNSKQGVGEIISIYNSYMFTKDDVCYDTLKEGDIVKFRAEKVHDKNKAFFINKYELTDEIGGKIEKSKIYKSDKY
jgi:hypothetical protein